MTKTTPAVNFSRRKNLLGLPVDLFTMEETLAEVRRILRERTGPVQHSALNAAKVVKAQRDVLLRDSILRSGIINPDGQALVWAGRLLDVPLPERVAGIDLMQKLVALAEADGYGIFLLGATAEVLAATREKLLRRHPRLHVAGTHHGYFSRDEDVEVAKMVRSSGAQMLFVALPTPRKEYFLKDFGEFMGVPFQMGVGGSFDVIAGKTPRAPVWMQRRGLEWLFRLLQEPGRMWKRYLVTNTRFLILVAAYWLQKKRQKHD